MIEQLMQEWKVGDFAVAESIFRSRQRQLKQKGGAQLRQKMQVAPCCHGLRLILPGFSYGIFGQPS